MKKILTSKAAVLSGKQNAKPCRVAGKNIASIGVLVCVLMGMAAGLTGCQDTAEVRDVKGGYRYKTTGQVTLQENFKGATLADTIPVKLTNESGQLEVVSLYNEDSLLITFDQLNGDVCYTRGTTDGKTIHFAPYTRTLEIPFETTKYDTLHLGTTLFPRDTVITYTKRETEIFNITVSGSALVFENNLIFDLKYSGKSQTTERTLTSRGVRMQAKKN